MVTLLVDMWVNVDCFLFQWDELCVCSFTGKGQNEVCPGSELKKKVTMNAYIYPEYSCKVSLQTALYFELQERNKFVATYGAYIC
jgi:hypothetical protein